MAAPTIRYDIRERLIPSGELTSPNQAVYGEEHVAALRLARGWQVRPDNPAAREMRRVTDPAVPGAALAVVGLDVLGDRVLSALRRLAQEDRLTRG